MFKHSFKYTLCTKSMLGTKLTHLLLYKSIQKETSSAQLSQLHLYCIIYTLTFKI